MNLYYCQFRNEDETGFFTYDTYDSAVIQCNSKEKAKKLFLTLEHDSDYDHIHIEKIGTNEQNEEKFIIKSFNAG